MSAYNTAFRASVAAKMAEKGWRVADLARRAGLKYTTVDTILKSDGDFHYARAMAINDALKGKRVNPETDGA